MILKATTQLIGFARAISDGAYQAAIYDVAIVPEFQHKGIGTAVIQKILARLAHCNIILYASPGKEGFYRKPGMWKMKTGMALFLNAEEKKKKDLRNELSDVHESYLTVVQEGNST